MPRETQTSVSGHLVRRPWSCQAMRLIFAAINETLRSDDRRLVSLKVIGPPEKSEGASVFSLLP